MKDFERHIALRIKNGRGQGVGSRYLPFLTVRDATRGGFRHRVPSVFCDRSHHLLSKIELQWFHIWAFCPGVVEIREQYPLFPRSETQRIAEKLKIRYPRYPDRKTPLVLTTDLVVFIRRRGRLMVRACAVKPRGKLEELSVKQKLQIEREYWREKGVPFLVLTDDNLPHPLCGVLGWLYGARCKKFELPSHLPELAAIVRKRSHSDPFHMACLHADKFFGHPPGSSMSIARHMLARRLWQPSRGLADLARLLGGVRTDPRVPLR